MQPNPEPNESLPVAIPTNSLVKKLDGQQSQFQRPRAPRQKPKPAMEIPSNQELSQGMQMLSPIQLSLNCSHNTSIGMGDKPDADSLSERPTHNVRGDMNRIEEQDDHGSATSSGDDGRDQGEVEEYTPKSLGALHPLESHFLDEINSHKTSLKDIKSICRAYGLNPNTPKHLPPHSTADIIQLSESFMSIRTRETPLRQLQDEDFEAMMQFGNLPPTLVTDKSKRGEAITVFNRWWTQSLEDIGRISPSEMAAYPIPGIRALIGVAGYKVDDSSTTKVTSITVLKRTQGLLALQGLSMRPYSNDYFNISTPEILDMASSHLICLLYCAFGSDIDTFDLDNIDEIKITIAQSQACSIDSTVFADDNLTTLDARDLRILNDMYGFDYAATEQCSREELQQMLPAVLDTTFPHIPSYKPPPPRTVNKIADRLSTLSLRPGTQPTAAGNPEAQSGRPTTATRTQTEENDDEQPDTHRDYWDPIDAGTRTGGSAHTALNQGWSKNRLICHLQSVDPHPAPYYERMSPVTLQALMESRSTPIEYRLSNYNNAPMRISVSDLNMTPHLTLRQMLGQLWTCPVESLVRLQDRELTEEIWNSLGPTAPGPLPAPTTQPLMTALTTSTASHDPTTTAQLRQLEKVSNTVEKASETAAKSSRKADEGTRNLYDNLHDRSFHDLCCDDPPSSGASIPMSKLIATLYGGVYVQLSLRAYIDLANTFTNVSFQDFIPLQQFMEQSTALRTITPYATWRSEKPCPRKAIDYTNNDPELWRIIIRTLLNLTADILDLSPDVRTLCDIIANNVKRKLTSFPHWSITTCIFVAKKACEQFDLLRNHITSTSRRTLTWQVEGTTTGLGHTKYSTRMEIIIAGSIIPSWTTPEEIAQYSLQMHDSSVLQREGRASQYITPVGHGLTHGGTRPTGTGSSPLPERPGQQPTPKERGPRTGGPVKKGPHHCLHFLHSLGGGEPCQRGDDRCPFLHLTSFASAQAFDHVQNVAAKNNITLDTSKFGKRPFDAKYPEANPTKKPKKQEATFNTALNRKPVGAKVSTRKRVAQYDPVQSILADKNAISAEGELDEGDCGFDALVASEYFYTELCPFKFHRDKRVRHALAFRLELAYRMVHEQVVVFDTTTHTRISTDLWENFLTYDDGKYANDKGETVTRPQAVGEVPRDILAPRPGESTEERRRRIATRWIIGEMTETDLKPLWLNADIYINMLRTHVASIARTGQGCFVSKLVKSHGPAGQFSVGPIALAFTGETMDAWAHALTPTTETAFAEAYPIINTINGEHFRVYVQRADRQPEFPYDVTPDDSWRTMWKAYPSRNWRNMEPDRLLRLKEMTVEAGYTYFDPDNLPPFNLPTPRRSGPSALAMEEKLVYTYDHEWDTNTHPYSAAPRNWKTQPFQSLLGRAMGLLPATVHSRVITADQAVHSGDIIFAAFIDYRTRKFMRSLYSTDAGWDPHRAQWIFPMIMANDDFFDVEITLDPDTLICVFNKNQLPAEVLDTLPLFTTDELTDDIRNFEAMESPDKRMVYTRPTTNASTQRSPHRTRIDTCDDITSGQSTYPYADGRTSLFTAPTRTFHPGQRIVSNIIVEPLHIADLDPAVMEMAVQIRVEGAPVYILRQSAQLLPIGVITDSVTHFPNCDLHWNTPTSINVRCTRLCQNEQEVFIEAGWYDHPPDMLSYSARCRLFDRYWHEFAVSTAPVLRRHIWLLADKLARYQKRLCDCWMIHGSPTATELASVESFILYEVLQSQHREQLNTHVGATNGRKRDEISSYEPTRSDPDIPTGNTSTIHLLCEEIINTDVQDMTVDDSGKILDDIALNRQIGITEARPADILPTSTSRKRRKTKGELKRAQREKHPGTLEGPEYAAKVNAKRNERRLSKCPRAQNISEQKRLMVLLAILASITTEAFVTKLSNLRVEFAEKELDYTDDSNIVREMKSTDPPKLQAVTDDMFLKDEAALTAAGNDLHKLYESKITKLKYRGLPRPTLLQWLQYNLPHRTASLIDLMDNGMTAHMLPGWRPNGGVAKNGKSVDNHTAVIEHAIATMSSKDRNILVREEVFPPEFKSKIHVHPIITAENPGKPNRVCFHMSSGTRAFPSYNAMVDMEAHLLKYKRTPLPTLQSLCDMFNTTRKLFPHVEYLHASVVDVSSAYQQYHLAYEKMALVWTRFQILRHGKHVSILNGMLVGTFGDIGAGDAWNTFAQALDELANVLSSMITSQIYVDDGVSAAPPLPSDVDPHRARPYFQTTGGFVADPEPGCNPLAAGIEYAIQTAVIEQRNNIARFFGSSSTEEKKVWIFIGNCIALGWYFNLRYDGWYVLPKPDKMDKIMHFLFNVVTESTKRIPHHTMQQLCGLLCWFSAAIPLGRAFVYTLFQCRRTQDNFVLLNAAAQRDLTFWRAIMRVGWKNPALIGASITSLGTPPPATRFIGTDGCTGVGGGAWLSDKPRWEANVSKFCFIIRWTKMEWEAINTDNISTPKPFAVDKDKYDTLLHHFRVDDHQQIPIHINVLEFATVVIAVMLWAPLLRGHVVSIGTDNTACLCWLMKNKASSGMADTLLKILALVCLLYDIRIVAHHVAGIINFAGDWLSRVGGIDNCDARYFLAGAQRNPQDKFMAELLAMSEPTSQFNRRDICRAILTRVLIHPDELTLPLLINIMVVLQRVPTVPAFPDFRVLQILDGFSEAEDHGEDISAGIPNTIREAYIQYGTRTQARTSPK